MSKVTKQNFNKQLAVECAILSQQVYSNSYPKQYNLLSPLPGDQGFVLSKSGGKELYIVLRGTSQLDDFLSDAEMKHKETYMGTIHEGFWEECVAVIYTITKTISKLQMESDFSNPDKIVVTGHSLGAALAVLISYALKVDFNLSNIHCYPIALPHVGHKDFRINYTKYGPVDYTFPVANIYDAVPYLPVGFGYVELIHSIHVEFQHWELVHNHSIEHYVEAIRGLPEVVEVAGA